VKDENEFKLLRKQIKALERIAESLERIAGFFGFIETAWAQVDEEVEHDEIDPVSVSDGGRAP